jgi:hypothetical protein
MPSKTSRKQKPSLDQKIEYLTDLIHQLVNTIEESNLQFHSPIQTKVELMEISQLKYFLGFDDVRSVKKWLSQQNIAMILMGKKTYIKSESLDLFIESKSPSSQNLPVGDNRSSNTRRGKRNAKEYQPRSKVARDFLKKIHSDQL